jgi:hypothetical protein
MNADKGRPNDGGPLWDIIKILGWVILGVVVLLVLTALLTAGHVVNGTGP